jgi:hypothetical protein
MCKWCQCVFTYSQYVILPGAVCRWDNNQEEKKGHILTVTENGMCLYPFGGGVYIGDLVNATAALRWSTATRRSNPPIRKPIVQVM